MERMFDWVEHCSVCAVPEKQCKSFCLRLEGECVCMCVFMRADCISWDFWWWLFSGLCLPYGSLFIFHHDIFQRMLCFRPGPRDGPCWSSFFSLQVSIDHSAQWIHHFSFSFWELITHFSPDWLRCLFLLFRKISFFFFASDVFKRKFLGVCVCIMRCIPE